MRIDAALLAAWLLAGAAGGADRLLCTPPTARIAFPANEDWRKHAGLQVVVTAKGERPESPLLASLYFQTKQDVWVKTREPLVLTGEPQTWSLRLDDSSPDWLPVNARRSYGRDLLRWVREWGIEVYCESEFTGSLAVAPPVFRPAGETPLELVRLEAPFVAPPGRTVPIRFELTGFDANPWSADELVAQLRWKDESGVSFAPAYFRQDFVPVAGPAGGAPSLQPLGRPYWQVDWRPPRAGRYRPTLEVVADRRRLSARLDTIAVAAHAPVPAPDAGATWPTADPTNVAAFARNVDGMRLLEYRNGRWTESDRARRPRQVWELPLDWTPAWGHYTGAGEFDQRIAWRFEQVVRSRTNDPLPILVFDEDVLDNSGRFNWQDHPLNRRNGGSLIRPYDLFRDTHAWANARNRAAYIWRRFGAMPGVSGLLLAANRPEQVVTNWTDRFAADFAAAYPSARLFCNNPALLPPVKTVRLDFDSAWNLDRRLTKASADLAVADESRVRVEATTTGAVGVVAQRMQHWVGAEALACDVKTAPNGARTLTANCIIRTDPDTVFQSRLLPLQEGEDNRLVFALSDPSAWECLQERGRRLQTYDLLNIREVGLRFFCQDPAPIRATLGESRLLWPRLTEWTNRPPLKIVNPKAALADVPRYGKFELNFDLNRVFNNPYDPDEIDVTLELTNPNGDPARHPAYFHEPWDLSASRSGRETPVRGGRPFWRVRYSPRVVGVYEWKLVARAGTERAQATGRFRCTPSPSRGFVRTSEQDPRYMEFMNGEFFFPIGMNLRSPGDMRGARFSADAAMNSEWAEKQGTQAYAKWFRKLRENGGNFARVWMSPWWCGLEWTPKHTGYHGAGYYNQSNAARLDRLLELAEAEGVYLNLETINHGCLSTRVDADWPNNPYNSANPGGYVRSPVEFFGNRHALQAHRNRLRYTIARWGYSTSIAWWGVITEAEWVQPYDRTLGYVASAPPPWLVGSSGFEPLDTRSPKEMYLNWISETAGYIRQTDAHPHLVSVHFSNPQNGTEIWHRPNLDIVQNNAYTKFATMWREHEFYRYRGVVDVCRVFAQEYEPYRAGKPLIVCEWGGAPTENTEQQLLAELHSGCWGMTMTLASGVTGYWWWNLLDGKDLYGRFRAVAAFVKGEDRRGQKWRSIRPKLSFPRPMDDGGTHERQGVVLHTKNRLFGYIYSEAINRYLGSELATGFDDPAFPPTGEGFLELPAAFDAGSYLLEYWNTFTGEPIKTVPVVVTEENRRIPILSHRVDIAVKLKPATAAK